VSLKGAKGLIINITGGKDITLYEVDEAANRIKQEVDEEANIIYGTTCDDRLEGIVRVSIVATGIDAQNNVLAKPIENFASLNINNDIYKPDLEKSELLSESSTLQENTSQDGSILDEEINEIVNEGMLNNQNSDNFNEDEQTNINQLDTSILEENIDDKEFLQNEATETLDQIETDNISGEVSNSSLDIDKPNEASVRRLSLFDTLSTENKSEDIASENNILTKTEPVFASSEEKIEENDSEHNNSEDDNSSIIEKEEFSAEESETSEIDDEFNQETEEELLDIPTFLRRQAN
jgi:cell division protein FtsZ